jgi:ferredoxin
MRKPWVDPSLCQSAEICVSVAPGMFRLSEEGLSEVYNAEGADEATVQQAIDSCPYQAIKWVEE